MKIKIQRPKFWDIYEIVDDDNKGLVEELFLDTMKEWKKEKHRRSSSSEIEYLNSLKPDFCPHCKSISYVSNGHRKDGLQTYKCKKCGIRFNILTGTIFDSHKIPISEWIEYLIHLFEFHSIRTSARDNQNVYSTGKYWLIKVFDVLKHYQDDIVLKKRVYFDETYFKKTRSQIDKTVRKSNLITVGVAYDGVNVVALNENVKKESFCSTLQYFESKIEPGSVFIHDGNYSHKELIEVLHLIEVKHPYSHTKNLSPKKNPMYPINNMHSYIKKFIEDKNGFNRDELQDWCNLFCFIFNPPKNRYKKVIEFIKMAVKHKKVIRFRRSIGEGHD